MGIALERVRTRLLLKGLEMLSRANTASGAQPGALVLAVSHDRSSATQFTQGWVSFSLSCCVTAMNVTAQLTWPLSTLTP